MKTAQQSTPEHLTREALAHRLNVSPRTIDRWAMLGHITPLPHPVGPGKGRRVYYDWRQVKKQLGIT